MVKIKPEVKHMSAEARRELYKLIKEMTVYELYDVINYVRTICDIRKEAEDEETL